MSGAIVQSSRLSPFAGPAWIGAADNLIAGARRDGRQKRLAEKDLALVRRLARERMIATFGEEMKLPYEAEYSGWSKVTGPSVDMLEVMVRRLVMDGVPIDRARRLADVADAQEKARGRKGGKRKRGRRPSGARLWVRRRGGKGPRFVYIKYRSQRVSTEIEITDDQDVKSHLGALYALGDFVETKVREILGTVLVRDVTMKRVYAEYLDEHFPGNNPDALDRDAWNRAAAILESFEDFNGDAALDTIGINTGRQYSAHCTTVQSKTQDTDAEEVDYLSSMTARIHVDVMIGVINWFCRKYSLPSILIDRPKVRGTAYKYIPFAYVLRLLRACRGRVFDKDGILIGRHELAARYECVERFIWLYFYSGTRNANLPELLWHWDEKIGHISLSLGRIVRQGQWATVTNKRRGQSKFLGSLDLLIPDWEAKDRNARGKSNVLYRNVLHDADGKKLAKNRIAALFREVRELAGLKNVTPHMLKHAGVTICTHAGMDRMSISYAYSTHPDTLERYYTHLNEEWSAPRVFEDRDLLFCNLRKFSERPFMVVADAA